MLNKIIVFTLLTLFILIGCAEKKDDIVETTEGIHAIDSTDLVLEKAENEDAVYNLEYKFKTGDKFRYRFSSVSINEQDISTDTTITQKLHQTISYIIDMNINEIDADGIAEISFNVKSVKIDADVNGEIYDVKTDTESDSITTMQFAEHYAITGTPFTARVDKSGDLIEFSRIDRIVNKFLEIRELTDSVTAEDKSMLRNSFTQSTIKPLLLQIFRTVPQTSVGKDSSWSVHQQPLSMMVYQVRYENVYKVAALEKLGDDRIAVVEANIKSIVTGDDNASEGGVTYSFTKPVTSGDGKIYFNIDKGMVQKSKTTTIVNYSMTMEAMSPQGLQKGTRKDKSVSTNILELL